MDPVQFLAGFAGYVQEHRDELVARIADETYRSVPGYAAVPRDDFVAATVDALALLVGACRAGHLPTLEEWQALDADTVRRRVRQGVRAKDWLAQGRVFRRHCFEAASAFGEENGIPKVEIASVIVTLDQDTDAGSAFAVAEFDAAADELLREDEARRRGFIEGLLRGALTPAVMRSGAETLGLEPAALYRAVRIRPRDAPEGDEILRAVLRAEPTINPRGAWASIDGDVCGISQDVLALVLDGVAAGVGPPVPLEAVVTSHAAATLALETADRFGMAGAYRIEDLGALPMVAAGGRAADALLERFVHDVERSGSGGPALVETVAAYLARGLRVGETAEALHLHVNSLRKRLRRYEELTGGSLSSVDDLAAIWAALKRREMHGHPATSAADPVTPQHLSSRAVSAG